MDYPKVSIIILNWNGWKDTIECLESLYQITYPNYDVIVVDNDSKDDSVQRIKEYCEGKIKVESKFFNYNPNNKPIYILEYTREEAEKGGNFRKEKYFSKLPSDRKLRLILNEKNYGFAEGNNIGMKYALKALNPDYILLLNNDTIADNNFLTELVNIAEADKSIGAVGAKVLDYHDPNRIDSFGGWIDIFGYGGTYNTNSHPKKLAYIPGVCLLLRSQIIIEYNLLLDKDLFLYHEDLDLGWRIRASGYSLKLAPNAVIYHKGSQTVKKFNINSYYYTERNRFIVLLKNLETKTILKLLPLLVLNEIIRIPFWIFLNRFKVKVKSYTNLVLLIRYINQINKLTSDRDLLNDHILGWNKLPENSLPNRLIRAYLKLTRVM